MIKDIGQQCKRIDSWKRQQYPARDMERKIEKYANGGPPPSEDDNCEDDIVPLGFAPTFMKKEMGPLLDSLELEPGFMDMSCIVPVIPDAERTSQISMQINICVNEVIMPRLKPTLTNGAGRATLTGQAFFYRTSPNDWVIKHGRPILPLSAGTDILDSEWREWAFDGKISLRNIEERLKSSSDNKYGWNRAGLTRLKEWIMATEAEKSSTSDTRSDWMQKYDFDKWAAVDLTALGYQRPVDVYWYFKKNGKITKDDPIYGGHEGVDLYCISRFGGQYDVEKVIKNDILNKSLKVSYKMDGPKKLSQMKRESYQDNEPDKEWKEEENDRLLFYLPDVFKSIEECLVYHNDDAAVSGDQMMDEVRGTGKTAMPKLTMQEGLMANLIEGLSFASSINWSVADGVNDIYLKQLQRGRLRSGQSFPTGVQPMAKQNAMTGFSGAAQVMQMLDSGITADSVANQQGTFGSSKQEFASQAEAALGQSLTISSRRVENWNKTLDKIAGLVGRTLCRAWPNQREAFPCYYDAQRLRMNLKALYKIHEDEWDADRWKFKARRLAGSMIRQEAIRVNTMAIEVLGPIFPSLMTFFGKEILRALFGDVIAAQLTSSLEKPDVSQMAKANMNVTIAHTTGTVPPVDPMDDPMLHSGVASKLAQERTTSAMQTGTVNRAEVVGVMAVLQYAAQHILRLPEQLSQPAMKQIEMVAKSIQSIPVQDPQPEGALTEKDMAELRLKDQNIQRLTAEGQEKLNLAKNKELMELKKLGLAEFSVKENAASQATNRAKTQQDMAAQLATLDGGTSTTL